MTWKRFVTISMAIIWLSQCVASSADRQTVKLEYAPAPVDNPLKGLVPYQADVRSYFPHSMEFNYIGFADLVVGDGKYDWTKLEALLDDVARRGHQTVFRIYLEYPAKTGTIPKFLIDGGLKVHRYVNTNTQPLPPAKVETPDYADPNLRRVLREFIAALGAKYDGDPRIGFITAGLLGTWGEWHTYPKEDLFAKKDVQLEVMEAYRKAFRVTPILLRYPAGDHDDRYASNAELPFGYHDDSFAWATLDTGKRQDDWYYIPRLKAAGALDKWKRQPIGGEIRPEAWRKVFDEKPGDKRIQNFAECVGQTHVTWLMDSGLFEKKPSADLVERAKQQVARMGYEFHVPTASWSIESPADAPEKKHLTIELQIENRGVAPFYYPWKGELALIAKQPKNAKTEPLTSAVDNTLQGILPGEPPKTWKASLDTTDLPAGEYQIAIRVPNPLPNGKPVRFANQTQAEAGWLMLGTVEVK